MAPDEPAPDGGRRAAPANPPMPANEFDAASPYTAGHSAENRPNSKKTEPQLPVTVVSSAHPFRCVLSDAGGQRRTRFRGTRKRGWMFTFATAHPGAPCDADWCCTITTSGACPETAVRRNFGMAELRKLRFPPKHTPPRVSLAGKHARFRSSAAAC